MDAVRTVESEVREQESDDEADPPRRVNKLQLPLRHSRFATLSGEESSTGPHLQDLGDELLEVEPEVALGDGSKKSPKSSATW